MVFGRINPSGRLPVTFYRSVADLPPFEEYSMENRTYRFFRGEVLHPFGFGLSYTEFNCTRLLTPESAKAGLPIEIEVEVENCGGYAGEEVVQVYLAPENRQPGPRSVSSPRSAGSRSCRERRDGAVPACPGNPSC